MIIEYTYSQHDLKKKCYGCKWLELYNDFNGKCICPHNKVKERNRSVTDKACTWKNADKHNPIKSLEESLKQMQLIREGKLPRRTWDELKKELKESDILRGE